MTPTAEQAFLRLPASGRSAGRGDTDSAICAVWVGGVCCSSLLCVRRSVSGAALLPGGALRGVAEFEPAVAHLPGQLNTEQDRPAAADGRDVGAAHG